jgi:hypothetical protein
MFFQLLAIAIVLLPAFLWSMQQKGRGFFSAFLAFICTVAAAAIAFGVWEPLVYKVLLDKVPDYAWGLGLLIPFLLSLCVLRLVFDQLVKSNVEFDDITNFVGGMAFGAGTGYVAAGMLILSVNFFRVPSEVGGFAPLTQVQGNLQRGDRLWIRADEVVARAAEKLSLNAFSTSTPLAQYMPAVDLQGASQRQMFTKDDGGKVQIASNTVKPNAVKVAGHYVIDGQLSDLLIDSNQPNRRQEVRHIDGSTPSEGSRLHGFVVQFNSLAQERSGQVVTGPGQIRLIARVGSEHVGYHPIAVIAAADAKDGGLYRFRFDAADIHIASVGGGANAEFVYEFILPPNAVPQSMIVKNTRIDLGQLRDGQPIASRRERDALVATGDLLANFGGGGGSRVDLASLDRSNAVRISPTGPNRFADAAEQTMLPSGRILNRGERGSLAVSDRNQILEGTQKFRPASLRVRGLDRNLVVQDFATTRDTTMIQVTLVKEGEFTPLGRAMDFGSPDEPIFLIDDQGRRFQAVGYFYEDGSISEIRYTPGSPLQAIRDYPELSVAKRDQTLILLFRPTSGVNIQYLVVGEKVIGEFVGGLRSTRTTN